VIDASEWANCGCWLRSAAGALGNASSVLGKSCWKVPPGFISFGRPSQPSTPVIDNHSFVVTVA
jgi:hypothetical protein